MHRLDRIVGRYTHNPVNLACELGVTAADSRVELSAFTLHPIESLIGELLALGAAVGLDFEEDRRVRNQAAGREIIAGAHLLEWQPSACSLVCECRELEPVRDDDLPPLDRGAYHLVDECGPGGEHQE